MRTAAILVVVAGILIVYGSSSDWVTCSKEPCEEGGGLFHIFRRTGMDVGWSVLTTRVGDLLTVIGALIALGASVAPTVRRRSPTR